MRYDPSAKLNRRTVALENLKKSLQAWKDAKTDKEIWELLSNKNRVKLADLSDDDREVVLTLARKEKIRLSEERIEILEGRVQ